MYSIANSYLINRRGVKNMNSQKNFSESQSENFEKLMSPESNWPNELRDRFDEKRKEVGGFKPDLDREVVSEYVQEMFD